MLEGEDLDRIIEYFRQPVQPAKLENLEDVKQPPNHVLMSYVIETLELDRHRIARLLKGSRMLNEWFQICAPKAEKEDKKKLPKLGAGITYDDDIFFVGNAIEVYHGNFARGEDGKLIFANKEKGVHRYPSGAEKEYVLLTGEKSANVPIFEGGYCRLIDGEIAVRRNSANMMLALMDIARESPDFSKYCNAMDVLEEQIDGIVIAHEIGEIEIEENGASYEDPLQKELAAEEAGRKFLAENGVSMGAYELFHMLRASHKKELKTVSDAVLDQIQHSPA